MFAYHLQINFEQPFVSLYVLVTLENLKYKGMLSLCNFTLDNANTDCASTYFWVYMGGLH